MFIEPHQEGVILAVRAFPGAKRNEVRCADGCLKVYVTQIPEKGKANAAIRKQLARSLGVRTSQIELVQGETSAHKRILLRGISVENVQKKIAEIE